MMKLPVSSHNSMRTLVVGAGKMGKLVIKHLAAKGFRRIVVVNRTEDKVDSIREDLKDVEIDYRPFSELLTRAAEADVIFTCTASQTLLFSKVQVYNVDDLKEVVAAKKEDRFLKAMEAQAIIEEEVKQFEAWKDSLETVPTIKKLRAYAKRIRAAEVEKCFSKMGGDLPKKEKKAIYDMSVGMQHLRCDGTDNRGLSEILENMHALNRIFSPDTEISVLEQKVRAKVKQNKQVTC